MAETPVSRVGDRPVSSRSFFEVYKRSQGTYTRLGTAIGSGVIILSGADFLYKQLSFEQESTLTSWLQIGIPLVVAAMLGLLVWWLVGVNRKVCDFFIATEGEMKKVSWSGKQELIGSTKVVIVFTALMAVILFLVDLMFMAFFGWIGVLQGASLFGALFGD